METRRGKAEDEESGAWPLLVGPCAWAQGLATEPPEALAEMPWPLLLGAQGLRDGAQA